ncbi:MAG TPA: radical SAM protein [Propionibacteriaceae bacterium]|nr:radical SAM protein [Propionibacteriaceae bacterium]
MKQSLRITIDESTLSLFQNGTAKSLGLLPGTEWLLEPTETGITWCRVDDNLLKLYIEATNACNLNCQTCVRNVWDERDGMMADETFARVLAGLQELPAVQTVHFGGYGEPLTHPRIFDMIARVKALGLRAEMITNGTLLSEANCERIVASGLDLLVVSIDGAHESTYDTIREGSELNVVLRNLRTLAAARHKLRQRTPDVGISFVAMKDNLEELLLLKRMAPQLRASFIMVTNLLPHTEDMKDQILYSSLVASTYPIRIGESRSDPLVIMPPLDRTPEISEVLRRLSIGRVNVDMPGLDWNAKRNTCRFVREGVAFVRWDGEIAPCMPLLHSYPCYVLGRYKRIVAHSFGSLHARSLGEIWNDDTYRGFRERVKKFEFSPCIDCGGCQLSESNQENCFGDPAPVCGDCLWAQGIVQCP